MTEVLSPPRSPYKGLSAFEDSELDALLFFGRERETEVVVANLLASRLTVLYGESGVGKSSILRAAVARELRRRAPDADVVVQAVWADDPLAALAAVREADEAYLILDQFEEYFVYHSDGDGRGTLPHELSELLHANPRVNVLISLREDALAELDAFKARLPGVFANRLRLEHLDRNAARAAIVGPVRRWNELANEDVEIEPALVEAVLEEVATGRIDIATGAAAHSGVDGTGRIEAPYLQLVMERIWDAERSERSNSLRLVTLRRLGGSATIVREHVESALDELEADEKDVAARMFDHLVTPSGTKIAHRVDDLAQYAAIPERALLPILGTLNRERILRTVDGVDAGGERYEIFHDVLAEPVLAWRARRQLERERTIARRRHRRLLAVTVLSFVALAAVGALAGWALSQRSSARDEARRARARELDASALQQLAENPNKSVRVALTAASLEASRRAEAVLRLALLSDRLRLVKHAGAPVRAVAVSPRGDFVAAALAGRRVLMLDAHNRRLVRTIVAPRAVAALSFARDGRTLVTASPTGLAEVWDVRSGKRVPGQGAVAAARLPDGLLQLVRLQGALASDIAHVRRLSAAPDGSAFAAAVTEPDGHVYARLYDASGRLVRRFREAGVTDVEFSPDGRLVAAANAHGFTVLWNARTARWIRTLLDAKGGVAAIAFSPDGAFLASGGEDGGVRVWNVATGERTYFLFAHTNPVTVLAWSPDGRVVASGSPDRTVRIWRMRGLIGAGSLAATLAGNDGAVRALTFTPDGAELVTGGDDRKVRFWDARPDQELELLGRATGPALAARWAGHTVAGVWPTVVQTFDARSRRRTHVFRAAAGERFTSLDTSADGSVVAAGARDGDTAVWDERSGRRLAAPRGDAPILAVDVSPRGDLLASGDSRGAVRVWATRSGKLLWLARQSGRVVEVAIAPGGDRVVTAGRRGSTIWSAADGRRLQVLPSPQGDVDADFSPDGRLVATAGIDANGRLWFAETGKLNRVLHGHVKPLTAVAFSADGRLLATSSKDADVRVWGIDSGIGHVLQRGAFGPIAGVAFDSTGRWVVGAAPISAIMWTTASGRQLFYLRGHVDRLTSVSFGLEPTVLTSSRDGTLRTYTCDVCVDLSTLAHLARVRLAQTR